MKIKKDDIGYYVFISILSFVCFCIGTIAIRSTLFDINDVEKQEETKPFEVKINIINTGALVDDCYIIYYTDSIDYGIKEKTYCKNGFIK